MASIESFFVTRTMRALEVLAFQPASAPQMAEVLQVDARTARRLLNRLADDGWLVRSEGRVRTYTLSLRLVALAAHFADAAPLTQAARDAVVALHERTGATAHLAVPSYRSVLSLVQHGGSADAPQPCALIPAHASAGGKLLLGYRERWRESVLELPLERLTDHTIVDPDDLRAACAACVRRGFGIEHGEYRVGLHSVAAPVRDPAGDVVAAVALLGTDGVEDSSDAVADAAAEVEARLAEAA